MSWVKFVILESFLYEKGNNLLSEEKWSTYYLRWKTFQEASKKKRLNSENLALFR